MAATPLELARVAATAADGLKASDIVTIDLTGESDVCDYFVICTATSKPQSDAVLEAVEEKVKANCGEDMLSLEGRAGSNWTLMDYGAVVVHVFRPEARDYFRLERLWGEAPRVRFGLEGEAEGEPWLADVDADEVAPDPGAPTTVTAASE